MAEITFSIPQRPEHLLLEHHPGLRVSEGLPKDSSLTNNVLNDLRFKDCLCILQQDTFDALYAVIRDIDGASSDMRAALCDILNVNISLKVSQIGNDGEVAESTEEQSCLKAYLFFLWWFWDKIGLQETGSVFEEINNTGRNKRRRKPGQHGKDWDWKGLLHGSLEAVSRVSQMHLHSQSPSNDPDPRVLQLCCQMAFHTLKGGEAVAAESIRAESANIFVSCMIDHHLGLPATSQLVTLAQKVDSIPSFVGEVCERAVVRGHEDVVQKVLEAVTANSAEGLSLHWERTKGKSPIVKLTAKLIDSLADHIPGPLRKHWALLDQYWDCSVPLIRNSLVSAMGKMLMMSSKDGLFHQCDGHDRRIQSFQRQALEMLMERTLDKSSYTRVRVLGVWITLVEAQLVPPMQFVALTGAAIHRLEDVTSSTQKAALTLLSVLLKHNPFSGDLGSWRFRKHLEEVQRHGLPTSDLSESAAQDMEDSENEDVAPRSKNDQIGELVATLKAAVSFSEAIESSLNLLSPILTAPAVQAAQEAISYLTICHEFRVEGTEAVLKKMFTLVFSSDHNLREKVFDAFQLIFVAWDDDEQLDVMGTANNLVALTDCASIGDMKCLEEIVKQLSKRQIIPDGIVMALLLMANGEEYGKGKASPQALLVAAKKARGALQLLTFLTSHWKQLLSDHIDAILQVFAMDHVDGLATTYACWLLKSLAPIQEDAQKESAAITALISVVMNDSMPESCWYGASEAAVSAMFSLCNEPQVLGAELLLKMRNDLLESKEAAGNDSHNSEHLSQLCSKSMSRFFFLAGHVGLLIMCHVEARVQNGQSNRPVQDKVRIMDENVKPLRDNNSGNGRTNERFGALDGRLEEMMGELQRECLSSSTIFGVCAKLVSSFCLDLPLLLGSPVFLQSSALSALTKFMGIDSSFCEGHLRLIFTLVKKRELPIFIRKNLVIAIQDFFQCYPNLLDPWTAHAYSLLDEADTGFRAGCLKALIHLMLNNLIKVKMQVSKVATLMEDKNEEIAKMAKLFFLQLSKRTVRNVNPIANMLPEILSNLLGDDTHVEGTFEPVMHQLLQYTNARSGDRLVLKLCQRLQGETNPKIWKGLAFTIKTLTLSEKGVGQFMECIKMYRHTLANATVIQHFQDRTAKSKRATRSLDIASQLDKFEEEILEISKILAAEHNKDKDGMDEDVDPGSPSNTADKPETTQSQPEPVEANSFSQSYSISLCHNEGISSDAEHNSLLTAKKDTLMSEDQDSMMVDQSISFPKISKASTPDALGSPISGGFR